MPEKDLSPTEKTRQFEGWRSKPYNDTRGVKTIGYGFNMQDGMVQKLLPYDVLTGQRELTKDEAMPIFDALYKRAEATAKMYVGQDKYNVMPDKVKGVLNDMAYNMGDRLFGFKNMKSALLAGDMPRVAAEMENSAWYRQVGNRSKAHVREILGEA